MAIRYDDLPLFARQQIFQDRRKKKIEQRLAAELEAKKKAAVAMAEAPYYIQRATELNEIHKVKSGKSKDPPFFIPPDMLRQANLIEGPANGYVEIVPTAEVPQETTATVPSKPAKSKKKRAGSSGEEGTGAGKKSKSKKRLRLDEPMEESGRKKKKSKSK